MKFTLISSCVALACMALAVEAAPSGKKINVPLSKNANYKPNAKRAIEKANAKYARFRSSSSSSSSSGSAGTESSGSVPVTDDGNDIEYYGEVTVKLDFDTGSSDLWFGKFYICMVQG